MAFKFTIIVFNKENFCFPFSLVLSGLFLEILLFFDLMWMWRKLTLILLFYFWE